jgi:hypothetical protein
MSKLALVTGERSIADPPRKLGKHGAHLWHTILRGYEIDDSAGLEMLALACEQLDRAEQYRAQIDRDGLMIKSRQGPKDHPLLKAELAACSFVARSLMRLGLADIKAMGRPPSSLGWLPDADE